LQNRVGEVRWLRQSQRAARLCRPRLPFWLHHSHTGAGQVCARSCNNHGKRSVTHDAFTNSALLPGRRGIVAAAHFAQHLRLYADFLYLQSPIYPLVLSKLLTLFSSVSPFLIARLPSAAFAIGSVVLFFSLAVRYSKNGQFAFVLASIFASAPLMLWAYGSARNDIMPTFFGLCGIWLALSGLNVECKQSAHSHLTLFFAGLCMALSVGAKMTAAFIPLKAMPYIFLRAKFRLLPFILGGVLGSLPIMYYAVTDFDKFVNLN
jgi:hypothetical protein